MEDARRSLYPNPPLGDHATPITKSRAPQPSAEGASNPEVALPLKPDASVRECVRAIQGSLGARDYQMSGSGSSEEARGEFHRFYSTLRVVLRETHPQYLTLLDIQQRAAG